MALEAYRKKRNFALTPEPKGEIPNTDEHIFVIQKHAASHLHYDFRLEMDGTLKSWAVPKGPSLVPGEKRLAVHVEDHPLAYADFEGIIPEGQYGGGTVIVWDRGTWTPIGDPHDGYAKGHLEFTLHGEKLHGTWRLVRMHLRGDKRDNWLLIKGEDEFARPEGAPDILEEQPDSVKTGRSIEQVAAAHDAVWGAKPVVTKAAHDTKMPGFIEPMLSTLVEAPPEGAQWIHEIKFDGYRLQAHIEGGNVKLLTRGGLDWSGKFGRAIPEALGRLPVRDAIIDGELVVETGTGASDFSSLQADLSEGRTDRFVFYAFDLLYLDGEDFLGIPLMERKARLEKLIAGETGLIRFSSHFGEAGAMVLRHACRLSLEGIVSKLRDSPYRSGRGKSWVKSKCSARQEFVIGGYVPSTVSPKMIGSLILGVHEDNGLRHVGRVGTGYSEKVAQDLLSRLETMRVKTSPFSDRLTAEEARNARYVRPELVAEVEFRAWTADGHLRHASFRGLREDKPASEITRESVQPEPEPEQRRTVALTHPDRLYWPQTGITKEGLADYYAEIWRYIAPFVTGRPLTVLRCPDGITGKRFLQKHPWQGIDRHIAPIPDPAHPEEGTFIGINDLDGLMGLVQGGVIEIHPWGSGTADLERPDMIVMDLDPGEDVPWTNVIDGARELRRRLTAAGLAAFVKTSGGKGLHVVSPIRPQAGWAEAKAFTLSMAEAMAGDEPDRYTATITKSQRKGRILIDYLRNQRGATAVAPYSARARPGAPVSTPLAWEELDPAIGPAWFTVENMPNRLATLGNDPWEDFRARAVPLPSSTARGKAA